MDVYAFKPAWWLPNPHLQTLWPFLQKRRKSNLILSRERITLPDGDFIDLEWTNGMPEKPIVLILHGLEGSVHSHYAQCLLRSVIQWGWQGVFMYFRGCSGVPNLHARGYHAGDTSDVQTVVTYLRERFPYSKIAVIGVSLGGNVLLKWLGETHENNPLSAAVAISVPFELQEVAKRFNQGFSKLYQWYLLRCLRKRLTHKSNLLMNTLGKDTHFKYRTFFEFDDKITAPLHGFANVDEYYKKSSCRPYLSNIRIPTLILHAYDDPFMTENVIPQASELSACTKLEVTKSGGHVGFVEGKYPWHSSNWLERRIPFFLKEYLVI